MRCSCRSTTARVSSSATVRTQPHTHPPAHTPTHPPLHGLSLTPPEARERTNSAAARRLLLKEAYRPQLRPCPTTSRRLSQRLLLVVPLPAGLIDEAEELCKGLLSARLEAHGDGHPDTLDLISLMASLLVKKGDFEEADEWSRMALEGKCGLYGRDHRETLSEMHARANVLRLLGDLDEAEELLAEAVTGLRRLGGADESDDGAATTDVDALRAIEVMAQLRRDRSARHGPTRPKRPCVFRTVSHQSLPKQQPRRRRTSPLLETSYH